MPSTTENLPKRPNRLIPKVVPPRVATLPGAPVLLQGRCCVCQSVNRWPMALAGTNKRFFCMKCERNTIHQKVTA